MLLYRTHKKLKKHTFKIKSKRVNQIKFVDNKEVGGQEMKKNKLKDSFW